MKKTLLISFIIFYLIGLSILGYYLYLELAPRVSASEIGTVILLLSIALFFYLGSLFLSKYLKNNKPMQIYLYLIFILYLLVLVKLTLFDSNYGRVGFSFEGWGKNFLAYREINLIPFKTIIEYIGRGDHIAMYNILGNILAFAPMGFFLPLLFKKQNKLKVFIFTNTMIILIIEVLQFLSLSGSFDIDDFLLNMLGALITYGLFRIQKINNFLQKLFILTF